MMLMLIDVSETDILFLLHTHFSVLYPEDPKFFLCDKSSTEKSLLHILVENWAGAPSETCCSVPIDS